MNEETKAFTMYYHSMTIILCNYAVPYDARVSNSGLVEENKIQWNYFDWEDNKTARKIYNELFREP